MQIFRIFARKILIGSKKGQILIMLFSKQDIGQTNTCLKFYRIGHSGDHAATELADLHTMVFVKRGCVSLRKAEREYMLTSNSMADLIPPEYVEITAASTESRILCTTPLHNTNTWGASSGR